MLTNESNFKIKEPAKPIYLSNLPNWIYKTIIWDQKQYHKKKRNWSTKRLSGMISPNLKEPIFIVGSGRSGTTFLGSCIGKIPEISYHFEPDIIKATAKYVYTGEWSQKKAQWYYRNIYSLLMRIHGDGDLRLADKTPRNSFIIPFLYETFPDAKFIHIIRDGRDVALSLSKQPWYRGDQVNSGIRERGGYPYGPYARFWVEPDRVREFETTSDIHRCIWLWRRYLETILEATTQLPENQYYELRYETLVTDTKQEGKRLLDFLEITSTSSRRLFQQAIAQARPNSVGLGQKQLSDEQLQEIEQEGGNMLNRLGYH
ncbi:MAG: sulfotransferase [Crocosphaera sp.]